MFSLFVICLISIFLVLLVKFVSFLISETQTLSREELTSYECGFEYKLSSRLPFSLRYYFLTLIFLLFDLEIVFLFLLPPFFLNSSVVFAVFAVLLVLIILLFGLFYEWLDGTLDWVS